MPIPDDRLALSKKRIKSVLRERLYATNRQLESKISESGPFNQRCDPHVITHALRELVASGEVAKIAHPVHQTAFYHLPEMLNKAKTRKLLTARQAVIDPLYSRYLQLAQHDSHLCGDALETVIRDGFSQVSSYLELGSKSQPLLSFGDKTLPGALDGTYMLSEKSLLLAVEAKNIREWIYPDAQQLWSLLNKANTISSPSCPVLPVLICRKIPYYAFAAFKQLGILGFEIHCQFFDPSLETELIDIKHKDGLGFHDIQTELSAPERLVRFLEKTIPDHGAEFAAKFLENKELISAVAPQLADKRLANSTRNTLWQAVKTRLALTKAMSHHE